MFGVMNWLCDAIFILGVEAVTLYGGIVQMVGARVTWGGGIFMAKGGTSEVGGGLVGQSVGYFRMDDGSVYMDVGRPNVGGGQVDMDGGYIGLEGGKIDVDGGHIALHVECGCPMPRSVTTSHQTKWRGTQTQRQDYCRISDTATADYHQVPPIQRTFTKATTTTVRHNAKATKIRMGSAELGGSL